MNNNKEKILAEMEVKMKSNKPIPAWLIQSARLGVIGLCFFLLLSSILLVSLFILDIFEKSSVEDFLEQSIYNPLHLLFEYILLAFILVAVLVSIYRKFDWPLVKEKNKIFLFGALFSLLLGLGIAKLAENVFFVREGLDSLKDSYISNIPVRNTQRETAHATLEASNNVLGIVSKIKEENNQFFVSIIMKDGEKTYQMKESEVTEKIQVGERVALHLDVDQKTILKLKIIK